LDAVLTRTPSGRLVQMRDISEAAAMLLENPSINGTELRVDGGWSLP
jgi:NAD(P)-dependent dehydrogenase (short-subunit alcohol dehydrogenase family)